MLHYGKGDSQALKRHSELALTVTCIQVIQTTQRPVGYCEILWGRVSKENFINHELFFFIDNVVQSTLPRLSKDALIAYMSFIEPQMA